MKFKKVKFFLKKFCYARRGIKLDVLLNPNKEGVWFHQPSPFGRTIEFTRIELTPASERQITEIIEILKCIFAGGEITGFKERGRIFVKIGLLKFSGWQAEETKTALSELFWKKKLGVVFFS